MAHEEINTTITNTNTNSVNTNNIINIKNDKKILQGNNQNAIMISTSILLSMKRRNIIIHTRVMITITLIQKNNSNNNKNDRNYTKITYHTKTIWIPTSLCITKTVMTKNKKKTTTITTIMPRILLRIFLFFQCLFSKAIISPKHAHGHYIICTRINK